jgi:hypothetical protein
MAEKTPKTKAKRASKGYRKFIRKQKAAERKTIAPRN